MFKFTRKLVIFFILLTSRLAWAFPLPQEDENGNENPNNEEEAEEAEEEEAEEEYDEEETNKVSTTKPSVDSKDGENSDNFINRNFNVKKYLSEKNANALFSFIAKQTKDKTPTETPAPIPSTTESTPTISKTRKYKVRERTSTLSNPFTNIDLDEHDEGTKKTFEITIPNDVTNNAGGTIEISIPTHWTSDSQLGIVNPNQLTLISKQTHEGQDEGVQSLEAAIQQALLMSYKRTGINISSVVLEGGDKTKTTELKGLQKISEATTLLVPQEVEIESNSTLKLVEPSESSTTFEASLSESTQKHEPEAEILVATPEEIIINLQTTPQEVEYIEYIEEVLIERTRKPIRIRTTTTTTQKPALNPIKALFSKQTSQNPGVSGFIFDSVINTTKNGARVAASAVWCALFDHCPGDKDGEK